MRFEFPPKTISARYFLADRRQSTLAVIGGVLIIGCSILFLLFKVNTIVHTQLHEAFPKTPIPPFLLQISRFIRSKQAKARRKALLRETHDAGLDLMMERRRKGRNAWDIHEPEGIPVSLSFLQMSSVFEYSPAYKSTPSAHAWHDRHDRSEPGPYDIDVDFAVAAGMSCMPLRHGSTL